MITFYPGPSRVYPEIPLFVQDAYDAGILSINHRSHEFEAIYASIVSLLKSKLLIPDDYTILFASSATECWEIIAQSLLEKKSCHFYTGAFGEKWWQYTKKLKPEAVGKALELNKEISAKGLSVPAGTELICLTQNETSNGTQVVNEKIKEIRSAHPHQLIAVDATSSMAGIYLNFSSADIWFASVQKCFGLPAGLGIMICSPQAVEKGLKMNEKQHYNSFPFLISMAAKNQTTYTPNVLGFYLLMRVMEMVPGIREVERGISKRYDNYNDFFLSYNKIKFLVDNDQVRSKTVLVLEGEEQWIASIKKEAKSEGIVLGNGYGAWAGNTFRIANFPAITGDEIGELLSFFRSKIGN